MTQGIRTVLSDLWEGKLIMKEEFKISKGLSIKCFYDSPILGSLPGHCAEHDHLGGGKVVQIVDVNLDISVSALSECMGMENAAHTKKHQI